MIKGCQVRFVGWSVFSWFVLAVGGKQLVVNVHYRLGNFCFSQIRSGESFKAKRSVIFSGIKMVYRLSYFSIAGIQRKGTGEVIVGRLAGRSGVQVSVDTNEMKSAWFCFE